MKVKAVLRAMTKLSRARKLGGEVFGDALGEIVLSRIAGEIGERVGICAGRGRSEEGLSLRQSGRHRPRHAGLDIGVALD